MNGQELARLINNNRFHFKDETELHRGLALVFEQAELKYEPEVNLTPEDRIDFMVEDVLGVEAKVDKSLNFVTRQMFRYAKCSEVKELILVTSRSSHRAVAPEMNGKPVYVVYLLNSFL